MVVALAASSLPARLPTRTRLLIGLALAGVDEVTLTGLGTETSRTRLLPGLFIVTEQKRTLGAVTRVAGSLSAAISWGRRTEGAERGTADDGVAPARPAPLLLATGRLSGALFGGALPSRRPGGGGIVRVTVAADRGSSSLVETAALARQKSGSVWGPALQGTTLGR